MPARILTLTAAALALAACVPKPSAPLTDPYPAELETAAIVAFTEGPASDLEGNVYFTNTTIHRIMKLAPDGKLTVFRENSNGANGLAFDAQGRLVACEGSPELRKPRVTRTDIKTGKVEVLAESFDGKPLNAPNDLVIDNSGRIYFTDMGANHKPPVPPGHGAVYRMDPDGKLARILVSPEIEKPNGITISPDDRTLYLIEANGAEGGARMIRAYDLAPDGSVSNMRVHYNFSPGRSADGMTIDAAGNIWAAAGLHRPRGTAETLATRCGVHVISPQGKLIRFIPVPEDTITNTAFGGPGLGTLYVTAGKSLFKFPAGQPGTRR
ncbi:MAG: SMP-30/gluconolactonase/LRE family protein [Acidobacteria bacterium]|nr:SMP-30/gluconolactonase/LRE family protein [Acidobacteriota bacterium]